MRERLLETLLFFLERPSVTGAEKRLCDELETRLRQSPGWRVVRAWPAVDIASRFNALRRECPAGVGRSIRCSSSASLIASLIASSAELLLFVRARRCRGRARGTPRR